MRVVAGAGAAVSVDVGEPTPDAAITFDLQASGTGGAADLSGQLGRGGQQVTIAPSHVQLENQVLTVAPLALELYGGTMQLKGRADFSDPEDGRFRFALNAQGLVFEAEDPAAPAIGVDAALGVAGSLENWAAYGDAVMNLQAMLDRESNWPSILGYHTP